jgi:hypothetical protein
VKWKIEVNQVRTVLQRTADKASELEPLSKEYADYAERAVRQSQATLVGQAVADFLTHYQDAWQDFSDQVSASLVGARDATLAYVKGHEEMALNAQWAAADAPAKRRAADAKAIADNDARQRRRYVE